MKRSLSFAVVVGYWILDPIQAARMIRFASPLQSLTIPDREVKDDLTTHRKRFLPRFKAGLQAEVAVRKEIAAKRSSDLQEAALSSSTSTDWAKQMTIAERARRTKEDEMIEEAYDKAMEQYDKQQKVEKGKEDSKLSSSSSSTSTNAYQFVGVVNKNGSPKPITWYARPKPTDSKWSVRLVHANQDAIIKDLFQRGKVDIFAKYQNTGTIDEETKTPIIQSTYEVRERSWKNAWNFSPKHFFTDPSGMYWRERRLAPGLYTDGASVYESSYRYRDGRNGMHRVSGLSQVLNSKAVKPEQKDKILKRLKEDAPDVVLEL